MPTSPGVSNLISWWSLDETSGTRADSHGSNDLTDNNTVGNATGKISNAADFIPANSEYLSHADNADLSFGDDDFTIALWVYLDTKASTQWLLTKYNTGGNQREYYIAYVQSVDRFQFAVSPGGGTTGNQGIYADTLGSVSTSTWYYIVAQHDKTANLLKISVNGGAFDTVSYSSGVFDGTSVFQIGALTYVSGYMDGRVDELSLWGEVLSSDEIDWLYNSGSGRAYSDLASIEATATDGIDMGDTPSAIATFDAAATDSADLSDTPLVSSIIIATATDGLNAGESNNTLAILNVLLNDGADFGETLTILSTLMVSSSDGVSVSESLTADTLLLAALTDGLDLSEALTPAALLSATLSDGMTFAEALARIATFPASLTDGLDFSDTSVGTVLTNLISAAATDGIALSDSCAAIAALLASSIDGVTIAETLLGTIAATTISAVAVDAFDMSDNGSVTASFSVTVADGASMGDTVSSILSLLATISDGFTVGDLSVSRDEATGILTVTFTSRKATITFTARG